MRRVAGFTKDSDVFLVLSSGTVKRLESESVTP